MKIHQPTVPTGCPCGVSRRQFLTGCAACAAGIGGAALLGRRPAIAADADTGPMAKVRLVFTHVPSTGPIWPNIGYDFEKRKRELLAALRGACPGVEFLPVTVKDRVQAEKMLQAADPVDGYLVYMLGLWTGAPQLIGEAGRPTVFVDDLYGGSGEFLIAYAEARRAGRKISGVSSSCFEDVAAVARCFQLLKKPGATADSFFAACEAARRKAYAKPGDLACPADPVQALDPGKCLEKLRSSVIVSVGGNRNSPLGPAIERVFGTKVVFIAHKELDAAHRQADRREAAQWADRWISQAQRVIEPSRAEIVNSAAMYLAMRQVQDRYKARAITMDCLGGFYGGHIHAYPCLGYSQMNDDGLIGACEADLRSTVTMLAMTTMIGRSGFISDPVIDTSKNQIIYAHCVAPRKVFGPAGAASPYHIRSHSEDRKGAVVRSLLPLGRMVTTLEFDPLKREILFHQGKSVENVDEDKACRTKLATEVKGDMDKLLTMWDRWSWHRVTFYGDLKDEVRELGKALGLKVVEEA